MVMSESKPHGMMQRQNWVGSGALLVSLACGGTSGSSPVRTNVSSSPPPPEWVARGSYVEDGAIHGVGSASGISDVSLARDTARNVARNEISKILGVFSASLMKDYQGSVQGSASSEVQRVERAIKTYSSSLLTGTEQRDFWHDQRSNTWFALVELNLERARSLGPVQEKMGGGLGEWVERNEGRILESLEEELARSAPSRSSSASSLRGHLKSSNHGAEQRPAWVDGDCDRERWICGVGQGPDATKADARARQALALVFESRIRSVAEQFQKAARKASSATKVRWDEEQWSVERLSVETDKVLPMTEISDRWQSEEEATWSLAVLNRTQAASALRARIAVLDRAVAKDLARARSSETQLDRIEILQRALEALGEREALNADLRVVELEGEGKSSQHSLNDLMALLEEAKRSLRIGLMLTGPGAERVRACIEDVLTQAGHQLAGSAIDRPLGEGPAYDVVLEARIRAESRGQVAGGKVAQVFLTLRLKNGRSGKTLRSLSASEKGTRRSLEGAISTAAHRVCSKKVPSMVRDIDRYFSR